jgi:glutamate-1-semialdehyde 2,1-aminomutase
MSEAYKRLKFVTPNGCQTLSKMPNRFVDGVYPQTALSGQKGHLWCEDGEYIDLISGLGALSLGYCDDEVDEAVKAQLNEGVSFSLPTSLEAYVAEKLIDLIPWTEMWKYAKTGTEANVYAVRCARAYTGRTKILTVGYNGCADQFEVKGTRQAGVTQELQPTVVRAEFNNIDSFDVLRSNEFACVLMEPMVYEFPKEGFLEYVRALCNQTNTLLIFDEVVWGGRIESFCASSYFRVQPDLITVGKGIANGFPISAVGGKRPVMETFERDDFFASGTFNGECISLAAALATLSKLQRVIPSMVFKGFDLQMYFNSLFSGKATCEGYSTRVIFKFPTDTHKALFMQEMCFNGVLLGQANFIMANHTMKDIEVIKDAMQQAKSVLDKYWDNPKEALRGSEPVAALRIVKNGKE